MKNHFPEEFNFQKILELHKKGLTSKSIAETLNISIKYVYNVLSKCKLKSNLKTNSNFKKEKINKNEHFSLKEYDYLIDNTLKTKNINDSTSVVRMPESMVKKANSTGLDPEDLLVLHKLNPKTFIITGGWHKEKTPGVFYSSIRFRAKTIDECSFEDILEEIRKNPKPWPKTVNTKFKLSPVCDIQNMHMINIADMHLGLKEWQYAVLDDTLDNIKSYFEEKLKLNKSIGKIVINTLGDTFHSNDIYKAVTAHGTELGFSDGITAFGVALSWFNELFNLCRKYTNLIECWVVNDNHSETPSACFFMSADFNNEDIRFLKSGKDGQLYTEFGHNKFHVSHKSMGKGYATGRVMNNMRMHLKEISFMDNLFSISAHLHHEESKDNDGVFHMKMGTKKPQDIYEKEHGWIARKNWMIMEFDYDNGLINRREI